MTDKTPATFPQNLAAIAEDNAGPRPISEAVDRVVLETSAKFHMHTAGRLVGKGDWASAYVELVAATDLIAKMGVVP